MWEEDPEVRPKPALAKHQTIILAPAHTAETRRIIWWTGHQKTIPLPGGQLHDEPEEPHKYRTFTLDKAISGVDLAEGTRGVNSTTSLEPHKLRTFNLEKAGHWGAV